MSTNSLHHVIHRGATAQEQGAPVLLLLHGYGLHEEDLMGLAPYLDSELISVGARPIPLPLVDLLGSILNGLKRVYGLIMIKRMNHCNWSLC